MCRWRNIVIDMWAYETDVSKTAGFQLAWDANRDPNKIVLVTVNYQNPALYDYLAEFRIAYPDRTIHGQFLFLLKSVYIFAERRRFELVMFFYEFQAGIFPQTHY